jgi:sortase (surface protein transpeptidase)
MQRRSTIGSIILGMVLLIGVPTAWYLARPAQTVGDPDAFASAPVAREPDTSAPADEALPAEDDSASDVEPAVQLRAGELKGPIRHVTRPDRIAIPTIGVDAQVVAVGLEDDGTMEIPVDVATIGWFEPGVRPGQPGTAVLAGHVDSRTQGRGAFFDLRDLDVEDVVVTTGEDGQPQEWRVVARTRFLKDELPTADLFTREGDPRLVLITCGGAFDATARSYTDNIVVYAVPA